MASGDDPNRMIDVDQLLLSKKLEPLSEQHRAELVAIAKLDVSAYSEMEVRTYVIDRIVRILGYDKGTVFSADLEHPVTFLGKNIFPDYKFTLWNENFWLIEAKKPRMNKVAFEYADFSQAIEYSVHPSINASLVVLCDGVKFEIFDREASVDAPMLRVMITELPRDFDKLRAVLEPMQVWFFQKRRVVRMIDKVFNKEFNMNRIGEFSDLVDRRLRSKHQIVIQNYRNTPRPDENADLDFVRTATPEDIIELLLFEERRIPVTNAVNLRLVELSTPSSFPVMLRIFPEEPRDATDVYMAQALAYLMRLAESQPSVQLIPTWLTKDSGDRTLDGATKYLLRQCLTYFSDYEPYRIILLAANAIRRIAKVVAISNNAVQSIGKELHAFARHELPEMSWAQILGSPEHQIIGLMDGQVRGALYGFVKRHSGDDRPFSGGRRSFQVESAKATLKSIWQLEAQLVASVGNYPKLMQERSLGDLRSIEWCSITYDYLGHFALCMMHLFPRWQQYALETHRDRLEDLIKLGSSKAREMLGVAPLSKVEALPDEVIATRFFFGDVHMLRTLRASYIGTSTTS
ncbi:type I restriction enzyme HsdR N-terminal domain-containing protein [Bradyrhizobium liaoningense]|uniref:type I restriction enzyme HsdR N-terminal domain-containing protein n=1 Tax=Bradyrhizobium liaoningense TaxID=43992 RepID=UPI001BA720F3|nr:type I restriction enzyme HsdR N-terminal domain-containing protein [Bradyrhizobium liaoningense]MBR0840488.1 type I restriction enzyme HsdR N-terminal domain-containing protein [Bradyrhizobium liaoningense]